MREIKFRAWNKTVKKFTYFGKREPIITSAEVPNGKSVGMFLAAEKQIYLTPYEDPQQFTGIRDKSEKEIYEGDIVHLESMLISNDEPIDGVVVFNEGAWWVDNKEECRAERLWGECNYLRVKGNVYENPELIGD